MRRRTILLFDDELGLSQQYVTEIEKADPKGFRSPEALSRGRFKEGVEVLQKRRLSSRRKGAQVYDDECVFDNADLLILDYDLLSLDEYSYLTGEEVAYLARCYSRCGVIVALNQFVRADFDLSLMGHLESFADFNLVGRHLGMPGLWSQTWKGFRPWHWPLFSHAVDALESRARQLKGHLRKRIFDYFEIPALVRETLPRDMRKFIAGKDDPMQTTFEDFVRKSGGGLRPKDEPGPPEAVARIAAARIWKWLERGILPGQNIFVDASHLVSTYPSLLTGKTRVAESWNRTTAFGSEKRLGIRYQGIQAFMFQSDSWFSRPVWFSQPISECEELPEVADPWSREEARFVFCEDVSIFLPLDKAQEFVAGVSSPYVRRFIQRVPGFSYGPVHRLSH